MRTRKLLATLAVLAGVFGTLGLAAPAQAAPPDLINQDQVNQTTNRATQRTGNHLGTYFELRSGYYGGYQYGWVRLQPGTRYKDFDGLTLQWRSGASGWQNGPAVLIQPGGTTTTGGKLTYAAADFNFRACLERAGTGYTCTDPW